MSALPNSTSDDVAATPATSPQASESMCFHCFDILLQTLDASSLSSRGRDHPVTFVGELPQPSCRSPLFVTWEKRRHSRFDLRGCIGSLTPQTLSTAVGKYAITSALKDRRFAPIALSEVPFLRVGVSLLVQYEQCEDCFDWVVGKHGIIIEWTDSQPFHTYSATFLPEVASEQQWDITATLHALVRKTGYTGTVSKDLFTRIKCTRYQSSKCKVSFEDYVKHCGHDPTTLANLDERRGACFVM